jgi:flagellar motility protein MotE (MotC chaperone)
MIRLGILPVTIVALFLLLAVKTATLVSAAVASTPTPAAAAPAVAPPAGAAAAAPAAPSTPFVANWDSTQPPPAICKPDATINPSEVAVLSALRQRAAALDNRAAALDRKQALVDASEQNLASQIGGLRAVEDRLNALSQTQTQASEDRWQALVATYQAMDPQAAAGIFNGLDMNVLLPVLTRMNSRTAAVVLADMSPDKARQATEMMAGQGADITLDNPASPTASP